MLNKFFLKTTIGMFFVCLVLPACASAQNAETVNSSKLGLFILGLPGSNEFKAYFDQAPLRLRKLLLLNGYETKDLVRIAAVKEAGKEKKWGEEVISEKGAIEEYFQRLSKRTEVFDEVFVFTAFHANGRDDEAIIHLPGADLISGDLIKKIDAIPAKKMTVVAAAAQGGVWIQRLGKPGRVVIAGNSYRQYDFMPSLFLRFFPDMFDYFAKPDPENPNAEVKATLLEVFAAVQKKIRHWYKENNLHCTELALIDADGDAKGDSLFLRPEPLEGTKSEAEELKLESLALKGESDAEFELNPELPDAKAAANIYFTVRKEVKNER